MSQRVVLYLPSLEGGGAERVFVQLANEFAALGLRVDLALASARGPYLAEVSSAVRLVDLASRGVSRSFPKLVRHLRGERPQALLSALDHANLIAIASRFAGSTRTRCVVSMRSVPTAALRGARAERSGLVVQLTRIAYRFADAVIANSKAVAADLGRLMHLPDQRVHVIYNPLDIETIERLSQEPPHHPWLETGTTPLIVSVGSLTALKNFPTLVRAFALVRQRRVCRLAILGEGPERARLEALVREQGLVDDVCLPGFMRNPFAWMRHARVFVSSSLTEGCPNAVMQALACGTPVVSTDVGGSAEILDGGRWGRLVSAEDPCRMAEAVESTLDAPAHPEVRQRAQDFALRPTALQYLRVLLPQVELETAKP